jgi:hypothetical protein
VDNWLISVEADWTHPRTAGSCYLDLPRARLTYEEQGEPGVPTFGPDAWTIELQTRNLVLDLGASGNPPESVWDLSWTCRGDGPGNDQCAGWIVLNQPGAGSNPVRILLYGTLFGIVLSLIVELLVGGLRRGRPRRPEPGDAGTALVNCFPDDSV